MLWIDRHAALGDDVSEGFNIGGYDALNAAPLAEVRATEAGLPRRRHLPAPPWPDAGSLVRRAGLVLMAIVLGGWVLTLLNAR